MTRNPEFRRNLTLELTPHRLIAVPVILGLIFATAWAIDGAPATAGAGRVLMTILLSLWGARAAADAVFGEVADRTWDAQRMSSIGPWTMSWGKLLGAPVFSWYGALCCTPAVLVGPFGPVDALVEIVLFGLFAHATALLISLLLLRIKPKRTRFQVNIAHAGGLLIALAAGGAGSHQTGPAQEFLGSTISGFSWYGVSMSVVAFSFLSRIVFLGWTVIGIYRLMRLELQFKPQPLVWLSFVLFVSAYVGGISFEWADDIAALPRLDVATRLGSGLLFVVLLTYLAAFLAPPGGVDLRRFASDFRAARYYAAFQAAPAWLVAALVAIAQTAIICVLIPSASNDLTFVLEMATRRSQDLSSQAITVLVAWMLFLIRDLGLIQFVILSPTSRRGHLAALMYLAVLYGALPTLFASTGLEAALPALVPFLVHSPLSLLPILAQLGLLGFALAWRWRQISVTGGRVAASA